MSNVKLDLSKFKHVSSDAKTTRLRHQDGHFLVLSHKNLGKDGQDQLAALAKGGDVSASGGKGGMSSQGEDVRHAKKQKARGDVGHKDTMHHAKEEATSRAQFERQFVKPNIKGLAEGGHPEDKPKSLQEQYMKPAPWLENNDSAELKKASEYTYSDAIKNVPHNIKETITKNPWRDNLAEGGEPKVSAPAQGAQPKQYDQTEKPVSNQWHGAKDAMSNIKKEFGMAEGGPAKFGKSNLKSQEEYAQQIHQPDTAADGAQEDYSYEANPGGQDHRASLKAAVYGALTDALNHGKESPAARQAPQSPPQPEPQAPPQPEQPAADPNMAPPSPDTVPMGAPPAPQAAPPQDSQAPAAPPAQPMATNPAPAPMNENQMPAQAVTPSMQPPSLEDHLKQQYAQEDMAFQHDLNNGHITPKTYSNLMFDGKSTLGKIGSIFGVLMAGAGSGLLHQENAAFKMMDKVIQNDIDAQVKSKANAQNFVSMNQQRLMNQTARQVSQAGIELTEEQKKALELNNLQTSVTLGYMQTARAALKDQADKVAKMPEGSLKQQGMQLLALMGTVVDSKSADVAALAASKTALLHSTMESSANDKPNPEQAFSEQQRMLRISGQDKIAEDNESRHLPASTGVIGMASRPLDSHDRESITAGDSYDKQLARFTDWASKHSGSLDPRAIKEGQAMAAELQGAYRMATHGGVYKEGEQNFISKLIDEDPTKFFNKIRVLPQLQALQHTNRAKMNDMVRSMGFKAYQPGAGASPSSSVSPEQQKMIDMAKKNPSSPAAQKILKHFGQQ